MARWIIEHFPAHRVYLEPFGGGASVLLNKPPAEIETFNDLDRRITRLFRVLRDHGPDFLAKAQLIPYAQADFDAAAVHPQGAAEVELALRDFVRWRQSFGGRGHSWSYSTNRARGGMAGNVNAWWTAIEQLPAVIDRLRRVQITCQSAFDLIPRFDHPDGLIYCDPPYVHSTREKHSRRVYHAEMTDDDHHRLADLLKQGQAKVVVSGYPSGLYEKLYKGWRVRTLEVATNAAAGRPKARRTECLWMNF